MSYKGLVTSRVLPGSIASELNLEKGDQILSVNGHMIRDVIDFRFYAGEEYVEVLVRKTNGEEWLLEIEKEPDDYLGLEFANPIGHLRKCQNHCIFCFVDQMPPGMRNSCYIKDDDYRLSFLNGNFITLTNLTQKDLQRIAEQRLSPLYVSVHTTNPDLRCLMMRHQRASAILTQLHFLKEAGIKLHTQIVLCPGYNDGQELERTVHDLSALWPAVQSIAVVPVGLTRYRQGLPLLQRVTPRQAQEIITWARTQQAMFRKNLGVSLLYLADEFYLISGEKIPSREFYDDFAQIENGVGLTRLFLDEWEEVRLNLPCELPAKRITVVTGHLGAKVMAKIIGELNTIKGLDISLIEVDNMLFGSSVTVAGLLTGKDIFKQLRNRSLGDLVIIPEVALRENQNDFLDKMTLTQLSETLGVKTVAVQSPRSLVSHILNF
ncbi:MAG: DUF512 domain-containing protein [Peptococcaceae bacterium]|nr:DUF512 domain-containing protein [Peptococcaceae bacterium]